jgi:serine/threonine protein kinase
MTQLGLHPHMMPIEEIYTSDIHDCLFIVMPYYKLGDLKSFIHKESVNKLLFISIFEQMIKVLCTLEEKNIIHRDIKPENFLISEINENYVHLVLSDFGLAKVRTGNTQTHTRMIGTICYMSPEMYGYSDNCDSNNSIDNSNNNDILMTKIDHHTDVWSCGIILYQILTKEFKSNTSYDIMKVEEENLLIFLISKTRKTIKYLDLNEKYIYLIHQMLQVNLNERITPSKLKVQFEKI